MIVSIITRMATSIFDFGKNCYPSKLTFKTERDDSGGFFLARMT